MVDINRMMRGSVAIYCEAPKAVADDISYMLRTGAEEIETLRARVARLEIHGTRLLEACENADFMDDLTEHVSGDLMFNFRRALEEK